jgi:signal transduction histidine kinase
VSSSSPSGSSRAGVHLLELVNEILDLSRVEAGRESFDYEDVMLAPLVQEVLHSVPVPDEERAIRLNTSIPATLRAATVTADARRLRQILFNLVGNAVKFGGEQPVDIVLTDDGHGGVASLAVHDRGPGIPDDQLEYVFGSFNQVNETTSRQQEGTGLGLAISRALAGRWAGN